MYWLYGIGAYVYIRINVFTRVLYYRIHILSSRFYTNLTCRHQLYHPTTLLP